MTDARQAMAARLADISHRRTEAFRAGSGRGLDSRDHLALIPEATTPEDIDTLHEARGMLDEFSRQVLDLYADVWREWGRPRCSVCGMTPKQAEAAGYDCAFEC